MEQQLIQCLQGTLSPDISIRSQAEQALIEVHSHRQCGSALIQLILSPDQVSNTIRHSAAISLRKWIKERWSALFEGFIGFPPQGEPMQAEDKAPIRRALLQMLTLSGPQERKLRIAGAACLSAVCSSDWPDEFPELLPAIQQLLQEGSEQGDEQTRDRVHGALAFLSEFWTSEMDERQILGGAREMLPTIEALLANEQAYPAALRARCVLIFRQLLSSLFMVKDVYKDASKQIANELLPKWIEALTGLVRRHNIAQQLADPSSSPEEKHGWIVLLNEICKTFKIASHFRPQFKAYLPDLLRLAIGLLENLREPFEAFYLAADSEPPFQVSDGDSDISTTLPNLLCSIVDFIVEATRADRGRSVLITSSGASNEFHSLLESLIRFARVTGEEEEEWSSDPNAFVAAIDEDAMEYGLRPACQDLIQDLLEAYQSTTLNALVHNVSQACHQRSPSSWKIVEAALAILGAVGEYVEEINSDPSFLEEIFHSAVLPTVQNSQSSSPLLTGRAYIFASQYASSLPQDLARQFVEASTQALEATLLGSEEETLIVKLSAVRCVKNFYRRLPQDLLSPFTPRIIAQLGPLLSQATGDTLLLVLETVQGIVSDEARGDRVQSGDGITPETYCEIVKAVFSVWSQDVKDFVLLSVLTDLFESLASKRDLQVAHAIVTTCQSALVEAFAGAEQSDQGNQASEDDDDDDSDAGQGNGLLEATMSIAEAVLTGAQSETLASAGTVTILCGPLIRSLERTQDRDVLQSGVGCLTNLVRKCPDDVRRWRDPKGGSGSGALESFLKIISKLLSSPSESGGIRLGDFIISLLRKLSSSIIDMGILPQLISAMIQRLSTAETSSFIQSLILPIAYLIKEGELATVLQILSPQDLNILFQKWTETHSCFQGYWCNKVSIVALSRVLSSGNTCLETIQVKGDLLQDNSTGMIKTRSRSKVNPDQYSQISLGCKIVKILIQEYTTSSTKSHQEEEIDDDDDEEGWEEEDDETKGGLLSEFLGDGFDGNVDDLFTNESEEEEMDLKDDDVWSLNLQEYLHGYLKEVISSPAGAQWAQRLSTGEVQVLHSLI
ncbi:unnamed protein product [Sympodiomycopsis kandeliae]